MKQSIKQSIYLFLLFILIFSLSSCNSILTPEPKTAPTENSPTEVPPLSAEGLGLENFSQAPVPPSTEITFKTIVPTNTPEDQTVMLVILDEVTGLALNTESFPMQKEVDEKTGEEVYTLTQLFPLGSNVQYRYERQTSSAPVAEHTSDGTPVRYRIIHVEGPGMVDDVVSRWTDTPYEWSSGRIKGAVTDFETGLPVPNQLVAAGGYQTLTSSDGTFLIEGLPAGVHNLVIQSLDGAYQTFQQGANVASESTTPANIQLTKAPLVEIAFVVSLPENTPPIVPVRIAGSLYQLGNSFANLSGGISSLATNMPVLTPLPDGRFLVRLFLPSGSDLRYKYTLGDGFWNAEHEADNSFKLRQLIIPETATVVLDEVQTWQAGDKNPVVFDINAPGNTPSNETVSVQFNPAFGWTVPLPMWSLGDGRWAYILYSPLDLPGELGYRFCRNGQCNLTDDVRTAGEKSPGFSVAITDEPLSVKEEIPGWSMLPANPPATTTITQTTTLPATPFVKGVEIEKAYHPSWRSQLPETLVKLDALNINTLVLTPTWTFTRQSPPVLHQVAGEDINWIDLTETMLLSQGHPYEIALYPNPRFPAPSDEWWQGAQRDFSWWLVWFEQYRTFLLHHADMAAQHSVAALIIGGDWLDPSLPSAQLADGSPSGVPADSEVRWRTLIAEIRSRYPGKIYWSLNSSQASSPPVFLDAVDGIYLLWSEPLAFEPGSPLTEMETEAARILDAQINPLFDQYNKPIVLAVGYPSAEGAVSGCVVSITGDCIDPKTLTTPNQMIFNVSLDLQEQIDAYTALLNSIGSRTWISGLVARGYYPPARLLDPGMSIQSKPLESFLAGWFGLIP